MKLHGTSQEFIHLNNKAHEVINLKDISIIKSEAKTEGISVTLTYDADADSVLLNVGCECTHPTPKQVFDFSRRITLIINKYNWQTKLLYSGPLIDTFA